MVGKVLNTAEREKLLTFKALLPCAFLKRKFGSKLIIALNFSGLYTLESLIVLTVTLRG